MKKFALALVAISSVVFGFGVVAEAQYGGVDQSVVLSSPSVAPGGAFTLTVSGCTPGETLTVTLDGATTTVLCAGTTTGTASASLAAPSVSGVYSGTVTGTSGFSQTFSLTVLATTPPGGLPATGSDGPGTATGIALGLLAVGLGLFAVAQVRRRQTSAAA